LVYQNPFFMKNSRVFLTAFVLFVSLLFIRCAPDTTGLTPSTEDVLIRNSWVVAYYYHNQDMTNSFLSSKILFSSTGAIAYVKDGVIIPGTWGTGVDASNNELITLRFDTSDPNISELNKSWRLTDRSSTAFQFVQNDGSTNTLLRIKTQ
jgi:hypothetical protein